MPDKLLYYTQFGLRLEAMMKYIPRTAVLSALILFFGIIFLFLSYTKLRRDSVPPFSKTDLEETDLDKIRQQVEQINPFFIKNKGQAPEDILYYFQGNNGAVYFTKEKIVFPRRSTSFVCALDTEQFYLLNTAYIALLKDANYSLKYLVGILNSKLVNFFYQNTYIGWQITIPAINSIPIPKITSGNKAVVDSIVALVDQVMASPQVEVEREIDRVVFELYELIPDEIKIVNGD